MKIFVVTTLAGAIIASGAAADGPVVATAEPVILAQVTSFEGAYAGLTVGRSSADGTDTLGTTSGSVVRSLDMGSDTSYGGFGGYNFQNGNIVYGVDVQYLSLGDLQHFNVRIDDVWDLRGRVGMQNGKFLFYATLGWAWASASSTRSAGGSTIDGASYGIGVEYQAGNNFIVGLDYTMRNLDGAFLTAANLDIDLNTLALRAAYKF